MDPKIGQIEGGVQGSRLVTSRFDPAVVEIPENDGVPYLYVEIGLQVTEISTHLGLNDTFSGGRSKIVLMPPDT